MQKTSSRLAKNKLNVALEECSMIESALLCSGEAILNGSAKHRLFSILGQGVDAPSGIELHETHVPIAEKTSSKRCNVRDVKNCFTFHLEILF